MSWGSLESERLSALPECAERLFVVVHRWTDRRQHGCFAVATQGLFQDPRQGAVTIRDKSLQHGKTEMAVEADDASFSNC